jgi:hypothetical protein
MKYLNIGLKTSLAALLIVMGSCASSGSSTTNKEDMTLGDYLSQKSGVTLQGYEENTRVIMRGSSKLNRSGSLSQPEGRGERNLARGADKQPLFVIDGQKVGRDYYSIASKFGPGQIKSVRVLQASQANMYGSQGQYGVIEIKTNKGNK